MIRSLALIAALLGAPVSAQVLPQFSLSTTAQANGCYSLSVRDIVAKTNAALACLDGTGGISMRPKSLYIDNTGQYVDRGALITIATQYRPGPGVVQFQDYRIFDALGDNTTLRGGGAMYISPRDPAGVTSATKGILYGLVIDVRPTVARNNAPFDDATGIILQNNGTAQATELLYFGRNINGLTNEYPASIGNEGWGANFIYDTAHHVGYGWNGVYGGAPAQYSLAWAYLKAWSGAGVNLIRVRNVAGTADRDVLGYNATDQVTLDSRAVTAPQQWTPTITCASGTPTTTASTTGTRWSQINGIVTFRAELSTAAIGTCTGALRFTAPTAPRNNAAYATGYETAGQNTLNAIYDATSGTFQVTRSGGVSVLSNGNFYIIQGSYEAAAP